MIPMSNRSQTPGASAIFREPTQAEYIASQLRLQSSIARAAARRQAPPVTLRKFSWEQES